jgi:hypothetical protein
LSGPADCGTVTGKPPPPLMPDSNPPPAPAPDARELHRTRRHLFWRRLRLYALAILMIGAIGLYAGARIIREHPHLVVKQMLALVPFPSSVDQVQWTAADRLEFHDLKVGDFFYASHVIITASPYQLLRHHIDQVEIRGGQFFTHNFNEALKNGPKGNGPGGLDWTITKLVIYRGTVLLQDLAPGMPAIPIRLGVKQSVVLNYVKLGHPDQSLGMTEDRMVELQNVLIVSPFDPLASVLSLPLIRVRFTYTELWNHHLQEVELVQPVLHLGQDLFWFTDQFKKERAGTPDNAQGVDAPWKVAHFEVRYGQLAVNAFGQPALQFPFFFNTEVANIRLDQLDKISAKTTIPIQTFNADYTDYKIKIVDLDGRIEFSIPPTNANANNVVTTIKIKELSWNGIAATNVIPSVTFDPTGIYGKLTGECEGGQLNGNFEVYYTKGFSWNADFSASKINCAPIAEQLAGKYGSLTGTVDGQIGVQGETTQIVGVKGKLALRHPGLLEIKATDDLLHRLPGTPGSLQNQAMRIAVNAFRSYPYETGTMDINYQPGQGEASLKLSGPRGKRHFSVYFHPYPEKTSTVAKAGDSQ